MRKRAAICVIFAAACGRVGFDAAPDGQLAAAIDAPVAQIAYVAPFLQDNAGPGATKTTLVQAHATGNAIVLQVACGSNADPTAVAVTAPGWTFRQVGLISREGTDHAATFTAIAPGTDSASLTVTWTGGCDLNRNDLGDEFAMVDPAGDEITFDSVSTVAGSGSCTGSLPIQHFGDMVWAACDSNGEVKNVGAGFTKGADDLAEDWSEYRLTADPPGTTEAISFESDLVGYVLSMVALKPSAR
jgi:hypothetical protein